MIKSILILIIFLTYSPFYSQYFPFKNENKFDTLVYKRIRDSLIADPEKNTSQTVNEERIFYDSKDGTKISMSYSKKGGGFLYIAKGAYWTLYSYFSNLQLHYNQENVGKYKAIGIWKEFNEQGELLREENMDLMYDDRPEFIDKKIKLVSVRDIAAKLNASYKKNIFNDSSFWDLGMLIDEKTNKWVYKISFYNHQKEDRVHYFYYDAHNGHLIKKESIALTEKPYLY